MQRIPVNSSNIVSAGYDAQTETLEIEFKNEVVWQYTHFPEQMWMEFISAPSKGKYFAMHIKERFAPLSFRVQ